jgi:hypothetical protein
MPATDEILEPVGSVSNVPPAVWLSLGLLILVLTLGIVWVFRAGRTFWRDFRSFGSSVDDTVTTIAAASERLAASSAEFDAAVPRLEAATAGLRVSLARLAVLQAAVREVKESVTGVTSLYPRK